MFQNIREIIKTLDVLTKDYLASLPNCFQIIAEEDTIVKNEEIVEVKTNISGEHFMESEFEIIFEGCIPSTGYLGLSSKLTEEGLKIFIKNKVPKKVWEEHDICGYHYCDPTTTCYFSPGVYQIEKGQPIGIIVKKSNELCQGDVIKKQLNRRFEGLTD
jgi:hypothetical protein